MLKSLFYRISSMAFKFLLLATVAFYLEPSDVALLGGASAFVAVAIYVIGLDLYIEVSRNLNKCADYFVNLISNQIVVMLVLGLIFGVAKIIWPKIDGGVGVYYIIPILFLEAVTQEMYRFNISVGRVDRANLLFFFKSGFWCLLGCIFVYVGLIKDVRFLFILWIFGLLLALAYGSIKAWNRVVSFKFSPSVQVFNQGLRNNLVVFSSSLVLVVIGNVDKMILAGSYNNNESAAYIFFSAIVNSVMILVYASVINPLYHRIIKAKDNGDLYFILKKIALVSVLLVTLVAALLKLVEFSLIDKINRVYLVENFYLINYMLVGLYFNVLSLIPHFFLFAHGRDDYICGASMLVLVVYGFCIFYLNSLYGAEGVAFSVAMAFFSMLVIKTLFCYFLIKSEHLHG